MKAPRPTKKSDILPGYAAMKSLSRSPRTIADYGKLTPASLTQPAPTIMQNLKARNAA